MFCAERGQRDGETHVGQGYDFVEATSLGNIIFRGKQADQEQCKNGGGHREGGGREFKKCGKKSWLHGPLDSIQRFKSYDKISSRRHFRCHPWQQYSPRHTKQITQLLWRCCSQLGPNRPSLYKRANRSLLTSSIQLVFTRLLPESLRKRVSVFFRPIAIALHCL